MSSDKVSQTPKSATERSREFRARKKVHEGKSEVRGIFAKAEQHEKIKKYAARLK